MEVVYLLILSWLRIVVGNLTFTDFDVRSSLASLVPAQQPSITCGAA